MRNLHTSIRGTLISVVFAGWAQTAQLTFTDGVQVVQAHLLGNEDDSIGGEISHTQDAYGSMSLLNSGDEAANYGRIQFNQSLITAIGVDGIHAFGASDVQFTYGDRVRSHGASFYTTLWFRADQTTAFESRATFALEGAPGTMGFRFMLQEFHGYESSPYYSTVFEFIGSPQSGSLDLSFTFDGVLKGDQIYALSFSGGGFDSHQVDAEYDFHLTSGSIPEPSSWTSLGAFALLVFGIVRRSLH